MGTLQWDFKTGIHDPTCVCKCLAELSTLHSPKKAASAFVSALRSLEAVGGMQNGVADHVLVRQTVRDVEAARLTEGGRLRPKQAPHRIMGILLSLALHVISPALTIAERRVAWIKTVQVWSPLRAANMFTVQFKHLAFTQQVGLQTTLTRTKTSGESRPTHVLEAYVD
eukprot:4738755-Amphidinium_carterae.1